MGRFHGCAYHAEKVLACLLKHRVNLPPGSTQQVFFQALWYICGWDLVSSHAASGLGLSDFPVQVLNPLVPYSIPGEGFQSKHIDLSLGLARRHRAMPGWTCYLKS